MKHDKDLTARELFLALDAMKPESFVNRGAINYYTFRLDDGAIITTGETARGRCKRWVERIDTKEGHENAE